MKVQIRCSTTVFYDQTVEMTQQEYKNIIDYNADYVLEREDKIAYDILDKYIDKEKSFDTNHDFDNIQIHNLTIKK